MVVWIGRVDRGCEKRRRDGLEACISCMRGREKQCGLGGDPRMRRARKFTVYIPGGCMSVVSIVATGVT